MARCTKCPVPENFVAEPACVERSKDDLTWKLVPQDEPVHLAALFRDPAIRHSRSVAMVLDLHQVGKRLIAGRSCWVRQFLIRAGPFPEGFRVAVDNGVRCPCPRGCSDYMARAKVYSEENRRWLSTLRHFDGGSPGLVICDRDLAKALSEIGALFASDGSPWRCPARFIAAIGQFVTCFGRKALIGPHPTTINTSRKYREAIAGSDFANRLRLLARLPS